MCPTDAALSSWIDPLESYWESQRLPCNGDLTPLVKAFEPESRSHSAYPVFLSVVNHLLLHRFECFVIVVAI